MMRFIHNVVLLFYELFLVSAVVTFPTINNEYSSNPTTVGIASKQNQVSLIDQKKAESEPTSTSEIHQDDQTAASTEPETSQDHQTINSGPNKKDANATDVKCEFDRLSSSELEIKAQEEFFALLTDKCRYDRMRKPGNDTNLQIDVQIDVGHIEAVEQLQFKLHFVVLFRYADDRLNYENKTTSDRIIIGETNLKEKIWTPHILIPNEKQSNVMGFERQDVFISVDQKGEVIYSYRMTSLVYCWMDLKKFPFDRQICNIKFRSWTYNATYLTLRWENQDAIEVSQELHLTEFKLTNSTISTILEPYRLGKFQHKFSILVFSFELTREIGFYVMDYFIPSILLVCTSWVTFWLQADNAAPRVALGTSTMLSFITLASGQSKNLPKVSYIKSSEIWFMGCIMFIFGSMAEFAFVNVIWRRKKKVELKKVNSRYILKSTLTPKLARKEFERSYSNNNLHKSRSCSSLTNIDNETERNYKKVYNNYLTVHSLQNFNIPAITTESEDDVTSSKPGNNVNQHMANIPASNHHEHRWTTMTPQEIAIWIDRRSRIVFPVTFLVFNIFYWMFNLLL